jgi:hypothetical protein
MITVLDWPGSLVQKGEKGESTALEDLLAPLLLQGLTCLREDPKSDPREASAKADLCFALFSACHRVRFLIISPPRFSDPRGFGPLTLR